MLGRVLLTAARRLGAVDREVERVRAQCDNWYRECNALREESHKAYTRGRVDERRIIAGNLRRAVLFEDDGGYHLQRRRHEPSAGYPPHRMLDDLADRVETDGGRV